MNTRISITLGTALLCLAGPILATASEPSVSAADPWIREAPPGADRTAAYLRLKNDGEEDAQLAHVSSPDFGEVEIHETVHEDDRARMEELDELKIPAGEEVKLEPGGKHLMLLEPREHPEAGQMLTLVLEFEDGTMLDLMMPVRQETGREDAHDEHEG